MPVDALRMPVEFLHKKTARVDPSPAPRPITMIELPCIELPGLLPDGGSMLTGYPGPLIVDSAASAKKGPSGP
jgi:hypothetical protein